jgi:exodeoxyribonuclease VII large subunit
MSELFEDDGPEPGDNAPEYTVSEISGAVKRAVESGFARVRVRGELGRVSRPRSGHVYLDLKDDRAVLSGVIWKGQAARLATQPEEGLEVIATGRLTTFPGQSKYQMVIESLAPAGVGALMAMLEKRKAALAAEGLFEAARKRPLPYLPRVIGVITSPSGAVIRDILHRLRDRFPTRVLIWPVAVQGEKCAPEVARAIAGFNALTPGGAVPRPDLLIVARGGGSIEDLWGFNEESVVRAAAASAIPLISAVGHETDTTLIDFAADMRAPTPTAAAELAVPVRADLIAWADGMGARLSAAVARGLGDRGRRLRDLSRALPRPQDLTQGAAQRLDMWADRLPRALLQRMDRLRLRLTAASGALRPAALGARTRGERQALARLDGRLHAAASRSRTRKARELQQVSARLTVRPLRRAVQKQADALTALARMLDSLSYHKTLERGYVVVRGGGGVLTRRAAAAAVTGPLELQFSDGKLRVGGPSEPAQPARPAKRPRQAAKPATQKSLFED